MTEIAASNRVRLQRQSPSADEIDRNELLDLHRMLMDEYRFLVKLNSDRTQIYLALSAAIIAAGTGLLKVGGPIASVLVAAIFAVGILVAGIAVKAVTQGHKYYRAVIYKKTLVEDLLGRHQRIEGYGYKGATLAVETTVGMASEREILNESENWLTRPISMKNITGGLIRVFQIIMTLEAIAILFILTMTVAENL
jgi:hypothetical protein